MKNFYSIVILAASAALFACAGGRPGLPGRSVLSGYQGKNLSELEARIGNAQNSAPDGRGGKIYSWSESREEYEFNGAASKNAAISSNPRDGTISGNYAPNEDEDTSGEYTVETSVQVWTDAQGRIYDFKHEVHRSK